MKLLQHVKEFKAHLENVNDSRLTTLRLLTETENPAYEEYLEKMWKSIFREEKKLGQTTSSEWVSLFLNAVLISMEEKPYFSMTGEERKEHLANINKYTKKLKRIYKKLGLDQHFLVYDPQIFFLYDDVGNQITDTDLLPTAGIIDTLDFYQDYANEEVGDYISKGKLGKKHKIIRLIRNLAKRNETRYGHPLLYVLVDVAFFMGGSKGKRYKDSDISTLLNGRKKKISPLESSKKIR